MKAILFHSLIASVLVSCSTITETTVNPYGVTPLSTNVAADESGKEDHWSLICDFDNDGILDHAISEPISNFGRMGGEFKLYLSDDNRNATYVGTIYAHPGAIALERQPSGKTRIWTYNPFNGSEGALASYDLQDGKLQSGPSMVIHPGDNGTDVGRGIYAAIFDDGKRVQPSLSRTIDIDASKSSSSKPSQPK